MLELVFFHAVATKRHRGNLTKELQNSEGLVICDHGAKEKVLWEDFKVRLGTSESRSALYTSMFIQRSDNLSILEGPFEQEEIDNVIKALPNNKSPGPDGFNNEFLRNASLSLKMIFMTCVMPSLRTLFASGVLTLLI